MPSPERFPSEATLPSLDRARLAAVVAGGLLAVGFALALLALPGEARVYDPYQVPKARYHAPLAAWPAPSYRAKDFTVIRKGAFYHLFYTRVRRHLPEHYGDGSSTMLNETTFGHAFSADLENWFEADTLFSVSLDTTRWDAHHLWAPTVFEHGDTTWMFFTGVRDRKENTSPTGWLPRWQVIGAAWSTDPFLLEWTRLPSPLWAPCAEFGLPGVPWALCNPTQAWRAADFRDPYVLPPEPGSGDPWLLYYTARPRTDQFNYVAGVAQAPGPRGPWTDLGALWDTYYPPLNSKVESPHVFRRGDDWHLLFTGDDGTTGIAWHCSEHGSPVGPWTTRPALNLFLKDQADHPYEFTLEPEAWFASEHFTESSSSGTAEYLAVVHSYDAPAVYNPPPPGTPDDISLIEFRRMDWDAGGFGFTLLGPNPVRSLAVTDASVQPGQAFELVVACEGGDGRTADLAVSLLDAQGATTPIPPDEVGLPLTIALAETEARHPWTVPAGPHVPPYRLQVSVVSQPLRAGTIVDVLPGGGTTDVPIVRARPGLGFRLAGGNPIALSGTGGTSAATTFELVMPAAGSARVELHDVRGRRVRTLLDETLPAGVSTARWDGRDEAGAPVPGGLYFARATTAFGSGTARVLALP